jgi:hypothetical protein
LNGVIFIRGGHQVINLAAVDVDKIIEMRVRRVKKGLNSISLVGVNGYE